MEGKLSFDEAFDEFSVALSRLRTLGGKAIKMSRDIELGKKIKPQSLKKLGGSIKWWQRNCYVWAVACMSISERR